MCQFKQTCHLKEPRAHKVIWSCAQRCRRVKAGGGDWNSEELAVLWLVLMNWWGDGRLDLGILRVDRNLRNKDAAGLLLQRFSGQDYISTGSGDQRNLIIKEIRQLQLKMLLKDQMAASCTWRRSRPVLLSLGTTLTSEVVAGYIGYGCRKEQVGDSY